MARVERKYLAHFLDSEFDTTYENTDYIRIGKDLEEFNEELNPNVETSENIIGETTTSFNSYEVSSTVETFYYDNEGKLERKLMDIGLSRTKGDECRTSYVTVLMDPPSAIGGNPTVKEAWREDVYAIPTQIGGDTSGVQTPFQINFDGNRTKGTFDLATRKFTPSGE